MTLKTGWPPWSAGFRMSERRCDVGSCLVHPARGARLSGDTDPDGVARGTFPAWHVSAATRQAALLRARAGQGVAIFRGRLEEKGSDTWTAYLDDPPQAVLVLFARGVRIGLRADDEPETLLTQADVLGSMVEGEVLLLPAGEIARLVLRRHPRRDMDLRLDIADLSYRTLNLSGSGLPTVRPNALQLPVGEIAQAGLHMPLGLLIGTSMRLMPSGRDPFGSTKTALMFIEILDSDRARIVDLAASGGVQVRR